MYIYRVNSSVPLKQKKGQSLGETKQKMERKGTFLKKQPKINPMGPLGYEESNITSYIPYLLLINGSQRIFEIHFWKEQKDTQQFSCITCVAI